jgi:hypothetical protein
MTLHVQFDASGRPSAIYPTPRAGTEAIEDLTPAYLASHQRDGQGVWSPRPPEPPETAEQIAARDAARANHEALRAADAQVEDGLLRLPVVPTPSPPPPGGVKLFGRRVGGRMMPAFMGPSGLDSSLQPSFARNKIGLFMPAGNGGADAQFGMAVTAAGTATSEAVATTNLHTYMRRRSWRVTTASATAVAGLRGGALQWTLGGPAPGMGGFHLVWRWGPATGVANAAHRAFVGMRASAGAPSDVNPGAQTNLFGMGYDSGDANVQFMHNDASGQATKIDLGPGFPKPNADLTAVYEIAMFSPPGQTQVLDYEITNLVTGAVAVGTITTDIPAATALLTPYAWMSVGGVSSVIGFATMELYIESDY